jgi:hypothetical protein
MFSKMFHSTFWDVGGWYEASIKKDSRQSAHWTNGWPWFLLVTTCKTQNCDSEIISLVESNFNFTVKTGRRQTYSQRNQYDSVPTQDRMCRWLGLKFWEVVFYNIPTIISLPSMVIQLLTTLLYLLGPSFMSFFEAKSIIPNLRLFE